MADRIVVRVSAEAHKKIKARAEKDATSAGEAADALILGTNGKNGSSGLDPELIKLVKSVGGELGLDYSDALVRVVRMGISRHNALAKYAKNTRS